MTEIIFFGMSKRAITIQRKVRATDSYALEISVKHRYNGIHFFRASSSSRRITNIISVPAGSPQDPHRIAVFTEAVGDGFSSILSVYVTSEIHLQLPHSVRSLFFAGYHD